MPSQAWGAGGQGCIAGSSHVSKLWLCKWTLVFPPASTWNRLRLHICTDQGVGSFTIIWLSKWLWLVRSSLLVLRILSHQERNWIWKGTGGVHENRMGVWLFFKLFCSPLDWLVWDIKFVLFLEVPWGWECLLPLCEDSPVLSQQSLSPKWCWTLVLPR